MATARVAVFALVVVVIVGFVPSQKLPIPTGMVSTDVPASPSPAASVPLSGFAGAWQAVEAGAIPSHIIIQHLDTFSARILYTWGDGSADNTWLSARAKVLPDGRLYWRFPDAFRLTLSPDGQLLIGEQESVNWKALATYRRDAKV